VRAKIRLKIKRSVKTMNSEIKKLDSGKIRVNKKEVNEEFIKAVTTNVQNT
jgi:hypothetical protein